MIELRLWRSFVTLAEELNFRRAADRLHISQPALTKQMQELEARLGVSLFRREARGLEPTEATIACLDAVRALLDQAQSLEDQFAASQQESDSVVRVGILELFSRAVLPAVLRHVRSEHPNARVSFVEMHPSETAAAVADGRIELGVARAPVAEQNVVARPYKRGTWVLVMPVAHRLAAKNALDVSDLGEDPLILFLRRLSPEFFDDVVAAIEATGRKAEIAYQAQDPMIGVELAANGIGLFLAVSHAVGQLPDGLVARPIDVLGVEPMLDLVWRRDRMTPALRSVIGAFSSEDIDG
jgi:DNA-binding transcriptional LysR family regulator